MVTKECFEEDYMRVYNFMCQESIEELMLSRLTSEEFQYAKQEIMRLCKIPKEELQSKVKEEKKQENYAQLSMVEAYILHIISDIDYSRSVDETNKEIEALLERNLTRSEKR